MSEMKNDLKQLLLLNELNNIEQTDIVLKDIGKELIVRIKAVKAKYVKIKNDKDEIEEKLVTTLITIDDKKIVNMSFSIVRFMSLLFGFFNVEYKPGIFKFDIDGFIEVQITKITKDQKNFYNFNITNNTEIKDYTSEYMYLENVKMNKIELNVLEDKDILLLE